MLLFAQLGVTALRYPALWEDVARRGWGWVEERLAMLRGLHIRPIVGLVHHGSGPPGTSLLDPAFAEKLAAHARAAAERLPWVEDWTPVNEPLTTARFSGLYGHWYPHAADDLSFARMLLAQCRAVALAMREIRRVNPTARLVQTEDVGTTWSTPRLAYQAAYENERRWLTFDLLRGECEGPAQDWLLSVGIPPGELEWFREHRCPPDVIGLNHYLTSDRFLDDRLERYPEALLGGNGREPYADVTANRVVARPSAGFAGALRDAWHRYQAPVAVTEVHNGSTRDEQLRWLDEAWGAACEALDGGVDVRAVTVWALLGAYDWDSLLTRRRGRYEVGAFDVSSGTPRPTAVARMARELAAGRPYRHPVLDAPGWWRRPDRLLFPPVGPPGPALPRRTGTPLLVTGAAGTLGRAFARLCESRGLRCVLLGRGELDIAEPAAVAAALARVRPWAVVNAAGYVRVDEAERDEPRCTRENTIGPRVLAETCAERRLPLLTFSSDLVFDGRKASPYIEPDALGPLSVYGRSKAEAEAAVLRALPEALVVRTSAFFGPWDEHNFVAATARALERGERVRAPADVYISPTYVPDLVNAALDLLIDGEQGVWHLASRGEVSWAAFARMSSAALGIATGGVEEVAGHSLALPARRPAYSVLGSSRSSTMAPLEDALDQYAREVRAA